jgi:hypothetical protein
MFTTIASYEVKECEGDLCLAHSVHFAVHRHVGMVHSFASKLRVVQLDRSADYFESSFEHFENHRVCFNRLGAFLGHSHRDVGLHGEPTS